MPTKALFALFLLAQATMFVAQGQVTAEKVNHMGSRGDRYEAAADFQTTTYAVFGNQPQYNRNPEMLSGYGLSTAGQLGITKGWNELPGNVAVLVDINPNVPVRHFGEWYYLDDCRWYIGGKWVESKNRFKPVFPPPIPQVQAVPQPPPILEIRLPAHQPLRFNDLVVWNPLPVDTLAEAPSLEFTATIVYDKDGRPIWAYLPIGNCIYAYSYDRKNWSAWGTTEKLAVCPAEAAAIAWWLWPTELAHLLKPNTVLNSLSGSTGGLP